MIEVRFTYYTGLKRSLFRNARLRGSWDAHGRPADDWTDRPMQEIVAEDVPLIPSWVGKNTAIAAPGMSGVEETLDPAFIFRFWTISKEG